VCLGLFLAVVSPWLVRQLATFGQLSPSTASGKVLFIRSIDEWNSITTPATLDHLLSQGVGPLLASRLDGLLAAVWILVVLGFGVVLAPFLAVGAWTRRDSGDFGPYLAYVVVLFAFSALVSAVHIRGGTFIHSAVALLPHGYVLALEGVVAFAAWLAARRRPWEPARLARGLVAAAVGMAAIVAAAGTVVVHSVWSVDRAAALEVAGALDRAGAPQTDRLMSVEAAGYRYHAGRGGVVLVDDPIATVRSVASAYDIRWLVLRGDGDVASMAPVLDGDRPGWIGPPLLDTGDAGARVALFPICLGPADDRCNVS
jgi:hypothetical protein